MNKKHFYLIVDTETTKKQTVADFGCVVVDRAGRLHEQFGALLHGHFGRLPLFSNSYLPAEEFFSSQMVHRRRKNYDDMIEAGSRSICSPQLVNLYLSRLLGQYDPILTAYNLSFDFGKCANTSIDLGIFSERFCLMRAAHRSICLSPEYDVFCRANGHLTKTGKLSRTADTVAKFVARDCYDSLADEPHTALEDARDYEAPILGEILKTRTRNELLELCK